MNFLKRRVRSMNEKSNSPSRVRRYFGWGTFFLSALLFFSGLAPRIAGQEQQRRNAKLIRLPEREDSDIIRMRAQWFFDQRAYPQGFIPAGMRERAIEQMQQMRESQGGFAANGGTIQPTGSWVPIGPSPDTGSGNGNTSGRVSALAVDPCDATGKTVYLGGAQGGLWKTPDGGTTWTALTDSQPSLGTGSIALDTSSCPSGHPAAIYVGTGEENFSQDSFYGAGVLKSTDGGATWTASGAAAFGATFPLTARISGPFIGSLSIQPGNNQTLLAGVQGSASALQSGIWRSTNGGANWTHVLPPPTGVVGTDVVFDPNDATGKIAFAALGNVQGNASNGVYKSIDGGVTWNLLTVSAPLLSSFGRIALAAGPSATAGNPATTEIFAAIANSSTGSNNLLGVFKSTNGGSTWTQLSDPFVSSNGFCNSQCWYDLTIRVSPTNPNVIYAGGAANNATIVRSTNGGTTWTEVSNQTTPGNPHVDTHAFSFNSSGSTVYVGNDGGVWSSSNPAAVSVTWSNLNQGLGITQFYPNHSIHPSTPAVGFGGTQDNGLEKYAGSPAWQDFLIPCDGGFTAVDPQFPSTVYGTCEYIPNGLLIIAQCFFNADQCGNNGLDAVTGINGSDRGAFIPPLVIDPSNGQKLYFGTFRVWQTTDGANSWHAQSPDLTLGGVQSALSTIVVAPTNSSTIYTGSSDSQVQVTTNGGTSWTNVSTGLPHRAVTAVVVDPATPTTVYATFSGFSGFGGDTQGHVFQSTTGGTAWVDISGTVPNALPNIPVNDLVVDPDVPGTLYVGTDVGVFVTTNAGVVWSPLGTGFPTVEVTSLRLREPSRTLRAATHGRSVWDLTLNNFTPAFNLASLSPATANLNDAGTTLSVAGNGFIGSSVLQFGGVPLTTTFVDSNHLTAPIPTSGFNAGGAVQVNVKNGANTSNNLIFTVLFPSPVLISVNPTQATAGAASQPIVVMGNTFASGTVVFFNGTSIATTFVNSTTLNATIPGSALATPGFAFIDVASPQPGGGLELGLSLNFTVNDPVPTTTSLVPPNANAGGAAFNLTVNGTGFVSGASSAQWNASPRTTTFVSGTQLMAAITAADIATAGTAAVTIFNPGPGGGTSTPALTFTINAGNNPVPTTTSIAPTNANAGGAAFSLTVNGTNFIASSVVQWKGSPRVTTFTSATQLMAAVTAADIAVMGTAAVTVFNPAPGGGTSSPALTFTINPPAPDFTFGAGVSPTSQTIPAGQATMYTVPIAAANGFNSPVTLSASGLPAATTAAFAPNPVSPGSSSIMTVQTTVRTAVPPVGRQKPWPVNGVWLLLAGALSLAMAFALKVKPQRRLAFGLTVGLLALFVALQSGCGGGGGVVHGGTPAGSFQITISGTGGGVTHSAPPVTLNVQ